MSTPRPASISLALLISGTGASTKADETSVFVLKAPPTIHPDSFSSQVPARVAHFFGKKRIQIYGPAILPHVETTAGCELRLGFLALVTRDIPIIAVVQNDALMKRFKSNFQEVCARDGKLYVIADADAEMVEG